MNRLEYSENCFRSKAFLLHAPVFFPYHCPPCHENGAMLCSYCRVSGLQAQSGQVALFLPEKCIPASQPLTCNCGNLTCDKFLYFLVFPRHLGFRERTLSDVCSFSSLSDKFSVFHLLVPFQVALASFLGISDFSPFYVLKLLTVPCHVLVPQFHPPHLSPALVSQLSCGPLCHLALCR